MALFLANAYALVCDSCKGKSPANSFKAMSADMSTWDDSSRIGCIIGFTVFGLAYIYTVLMIFHDMNNRKKMY